jgi:hypothetical protein
MTDSAEKSLKTQAEEIMVAVDRDLQTVESKSPAVQEDVATKTNTLLDSIFGIINDVDMKAATKRVTALRQEYPKAQPEELAQKLISEKIKKTGTIGAVTSGAGLIPGLGTAAAMTLGVAADIGATFKLQAELVLEIAAVYEYPLTEQEKQQIVMVITGISAGTSTLTRKAGQAVVIRVGEKLAERAAEKAFIKALPVVGVIASAGTNALSTYIIGQRADAYFRLGPDAVGSWSDSLRTITGVDERKVTSWLAESGKSAGHAVTARAGKVAGTVGSGLNSGGQMAKSAAHTTGGWLGGLGRGIFSGIKKVGGVSWAVISFIPRKVIGLFRRGERE